MRKQSSIKEVLLNAPSNIFWDIIDLLTSRFGSNLERYYERNIGREYIREYKLFDIKPTDKILHIGSGSFPLSEMILSRIVDTKVIGIDKNPVTIRRAKEVIRRRTLEDSIEILEGDGTNYPMENFDIVIISSCAQPKIPILNHVFKDLDRGNKVILREKEISIKPLIEYIIRCDKIEIIDKITHHPFPFYHPLGWESYYLQKK